MIPSLKIRDRPSKVRQPSVITTPREKNTERSTKKRCPSPSRNAPMSPSAHLGKLGRDRKRDCVHDQKSWRARPKKTTETQLEAPKEARLRRKLFLPRTSPWSSQGPPERNSVESGGGGDVNVLFSLFWGSGSSDVSKVWDGFQTLPSRYFLGRPQGEKEVEVRGGEGSSREGLSSTGGWKKKRSKQF